MGKRTRTFVVKKERRGSAQLRGEPVAVKTQAWVKRMEVFVMLIANELPRQYGP